MDLSASGFDGKDRDLVLGRKTYGPGGDIQPGSFASAEPSEKELARRKKMAKEMW